MLVAGVQNSFDLRLRKTTGNEIRINKLSPIAENNNSKSLYHTAVLPVPLSGRSQPCKLIC